MSGRGAVQGRTAIVVGFVLIAGLTAQLVASPATATSPGTNGLIAFETDRNGGQRDIYVMDADGSNQVRLTTSTFDDSSPGFSGNGERIAFASGRDGNIEVYAMDANGAGQTNLSVNAAVDDTPAFSPDGAKIAFASNRDGGPGNSDVYAMNASGSSPTRLTEAAGQDFNPVYSPDGTRIAFESHRDPAGEIYAMQSDGSDEVDLTNNAADEGDPSYSPDGTRIAFVSSRDGNSEIYVMNANGSGQTRLTTNSAFDSDPAFSPDGGKIAFSSNRDGNLEVYVMNADGSQQVRLTTNGGVDFRPDWQTTDTAPPPPPPPPPAGTPPANVTKPTIVGSQIRATADVYSCKEGAWTGLLADPAFAYRWYRLDGDRWNVVGQESTYRLRNPEVGKTFVCEVSVANEAGRTAAQSDPRVLTGLTEDTWTPPKATPYGDFRVLGIDVFQVVQPNSCAQMFGFPDGAFPNYAGGGTPTAYLSDPNCTGFSLPAGADPQRVAYEGVTLDGSKSTTAVVYLAMRDAAPGPAGRLELKLTGSVGGRTVYSQTQEIGRPPFADRPFVTLEQRDGLTGGQRIGFQFTLPSYLLYAASGGSLSLTAEASPPVTATLLGFNQCAATDCHANDRFRLLGVPVESPPPLTIASVELIGRPPATAANQSSLPAADKLLATARKMLPGGAKMLVQPYSATLDTGFEMNLSMADHECEDIEFKDVRGCRQYYVGQRVESWRWAQINALQGSEPWDILFAAHDYAFDNGAGPEPGWTSGGTPTLIDQKYLAPLFTSNAGGTRPLTATTHELGHVLGAPHAGQNCPGTAATDAQAGETWPTDQTGRLQGTAFLTSRRGADGLVQPLADEDSNQLFDLMSYCAGEATAWLSARNWERALNALLAYRAARVAPRAPRSGGGPKLARAAVKRSLVSGVVGPGGASIGRIVPLEGASPQVPPSDPSSQVRLRALGAGGAVLEESAAAVMSLSDSSDAGGMFIGTVPAEASVVEVIRDGVVLDRRGRSERPSVRLVRPKSRTNVAANGRLDVRWKASDPDTPDLDATVEYSADNGRSWRSIYDGPSTGGVRVDGGALAGTERGRVRVTISDGFNDASAVSPRFEVAGAPPVVEMLAPAPREAVVGGQRVLLEGAAVAEDGRRLGGRSLRWFEGNRKFGTGGYLTKRLQPGRSRLRLVAVDRNGRRASVARTVRVDARRLELTALDAPTRVSDDARQVDVKVVISAPATLHAGGRNIRLAPGANRASVPIPAKPRSGVVRVRFNLQARGPLANGRVKGTFVMIRT